jgi:hypothetical protein
MDVMLKDQVASFVNLVGPDIIVILLTIAILSVPGAIALVILVIIRRHKAKPPPLPRATTPSDDH